MGKLDELRRDLAELTPAELEHLVFELVRHEFSQAIKPDAPDGGADVLVPVIRRVFQVKHHPAGPRWKNCVESLDRAVSEHKAKHVTFCFPRDLTAPMLRKFETKLGERYPAITVDHWTLSELDFRLEQQPLLRERHFERVRNDALRAAQRAATLGAPLDSPADLIERATELGRYTAGADRRFKQAMTILEDEIPEPNWPDLPYMTVRAGDETIAVRFDFWARDGVTLSPATWWFHEDGDGRRAFEAARLALAKGEEYVATGGYTVRINELPRLVAVAQPEAGEVTEGRLTLVPGEAVDVEFIVVSGDETSRVTVPVRPVIPRRASCVDFAGVGGALLVELDFEALEPPQVSFSFLATALWGQDARQNAETARFFDLFAEGEVTVTSPGLLPRPFSEETRLDPEKAKAAAGIRRWYDDIVLIEETAGITFDVPAVPSKDDLHQVATAAEEIRSRKGSVTVGEMSFETAPAALSFVTRGFETGGLNHREPLRRPIFGRLADLGFTDFELPPMRIVSALATGPTPNAPVRVRAVPVTVGQEIPCQVVLHERPLSRIVTASTLLALPR